MTSSMFQLPLVNDAMEKIEASRKADRPAFSPFVQAMQLTPLTCCALTA